MTLTAGLLGAGKGEPVPEHPYPGQKWAEVRHDKTVTWLAYWKDPISQKDFKYVWLAANSTFKSDSDLAKYEKARKLKVCCQIRTPLPCLHTKWVRCRADLKVTVCLSLMCCTTMMPLPYVSLGSSPSTIAAVLP